MQLEPLLTGIAGLSFALLIISIFCWRALTQPLGADVSGLHHSNFEWLESQKRAEALLRGILSEQEYQQLTRRGFLEVPSPSLPNRVYRVPRNRGPVSVFEEDKLVMNLCIQPTKPVPAADVVMMHKLMIEGNEQEYLKIANQLEPTPYRYYLGARP
jgi:hypothetical protein